MKRGDRKQKIHRDNLPAYVILNKKLYKVLSKTKSTDRAVLWNFEEKTREVHSYLAVAKYGEKAYSPYEIGQLLNRSKYTIKAHWHEFPEPYRIYAFTSGEPVGRRWDSDGVMEIRDVLASKHYGHPRNDGEIIPMAIPSRTELRAMLNQEAVYYVKAEDGSVIPTWKAHDF
jgi:hypothetical protein